MPLLEVENLTMRFGGITAVNGVSFAVEKGQIYSVIGPNGAGKTTVFNAVTGIYAPTAGRVRFEGHSAERPLTGKVIASCAVVGLLTAAIAFFAAVGVEGLWYATVKRPAVNGKEFAYAAAIPAAVDYTAGKLAVQKMRRGNRWAVVTADGKRELEVFPTEAEAAGWRDDASRRMADASVPDERLDQIASQNAKNLFTLAVATAAGLTLGALGTFVMWNRNRRSTDYLSLHGIARTFQNIRLFQHMTAVENVLIGMHRGLPGNWLAAVVRWPGQVRQEKAAAAKARELLAFVGIGGRSGELAKNLPYGDQRRLEIARALATGPKLLLLDEPAAGMNPAETADLMTLIRKIRDRGITVLLIEHHMSLVMGISDRVAVLDYGVKIAEGPPAEVSRDPKVIAAYLGTEEVT